MRGHVLQWIAFVLLAMNVFARSQTASPVKPSPSTQITIDGKQITSDAVLVHKGTTYVSVPALARALGASVSLRGQELTLTVPAKPAGDCGNMVAAKKLSNTYRKAAVHIPDSLESLRAIVNKRGAIIPAASFDEVDHQISEAEFRAQTEADKAVSYALRHASSTLAITYYKLWRGVPAESVKEEQLDSVLCSMESKIALQVGGLSGKESCSTFGPDQSDAKSAN